MSTLIAELKRRRVIRVSAAYIVIGWAALQVADIVVPALMLPEWTIRLLLIALVVLFPVVVLTAWVFQATPGRAVRTDAIRSSPRVLIAVGLATFALGGALGLLWAYLNPAQVESPTDRRPRVAILPLKDMSPLGDKAYFSDGIHEELISRLAEIRGITVPSRTTVDRYRESTLATQEIARELGADYLLEGSVRHGVDRVLVTLQLIDGVTDDHVWVQDFDRELTIDNLFDIQRNVARSVAGLLRTQLAPDELRLLGAPPTTNLAAYEAVLKGLFYYRRYNQDDLRLSLEHFQEATRLDPEFAAAWAGLANTYMLAATTYGWLKPAEALPFARQHGSRALALDPYSGSTISLIGDIAYWHDYDPVAAEAKYKEGVAVDPHNVGNRLSYAYLLSTQGRHDEAEAQIEFCERAEPNSASILANAAWRYIDAREYEKAIEKAQSALAIEPAMTDALWSLGYALAFLGRMEEASAVSDVADNVVLTTMILVKTGQLEAARSNVAAFGEGMDRPINGAMLYAIIGDADNAFRLIDQTIEERHRGALLLGTWEMFDPLRSDPRFDAALQRIGFTG